VNFLTYDVYPRTWLVTRWTRKSQHSRECKDPRRLISDLDFWPIYLNINEFPELIEEHLYVKLHRFLDIVRKNRQINSGENPTRANAVGVGKQHAIFKSKNIWFKSQYCQDIYISTSVFGDGRIHTGDLRPHAARYSTNVASLESESARATTIRPILGLWRS